ncbi:WxL domain-containing protein [Enterococcus quebecensis]|uniref:WxL domain-containing protein n=1 Tax=Enterococcus quebecensis TaxID=903983 RepID=A0A1E5GTP3_9ENTE|nr:WxL domain-containing protein [Enterococcus quebecensis]OEG16053.1 hypothetical protein BCR23_07860 [Enterococcus quebecensis]OJG75032.1 hypothetical protein RV12_GL002077 [Enterococcus quebecensis]
MKKTLLGAATLSALMLAITVQSNIAKAATTKGDIHFLEGDGSDSTGIEVSDPGKGGQHEGDGSVIKPPAGGSSTTGALRFNYIPSIRFGQNRLSTKTQDFYALFDEIEIGDKKEERPTFYEVVDLRGGTKGWTVNLKNDRIFRSTDGKQFKATLAFKDITIQSNSSISNAEQFPTVPKGTEETAIGTDVGSSVKITEAKNTESQGYGSWSVRVGDLDKKVSSKGDVRTPKNGEVDETKIARNAAVKLTIPGGQIIDTSKDYSTDLVWELVSAP